MLIDWPEYHERSERLATLLLKRQIASSAPMTSRVRRITLHEGHYIRIEYPNGETQEIQLAPHEFTLRLSRADAPSGMERLAKVTQGMGRLMAESMEKGMVEKILTTDSPGFARFRGATPEELAVNLISSLRQMQFDFDDDGNPSLDFVVHPNNMEILKSIDTDEYKSIFDSVIDEKRREWTIRESHRELVD